MKKNMIKIVFAALLILIFLPGFRCEKDVTVDDEILSGCIKGKLIVSGPCGQYVIKVLSGDAGKASIAATWFDPETSINYTNVFKVNNYCANLPRVVGEEFYFYFIREVKTMDCIVCHAARATPAEGNEIKYMGANCP